MHNPLHYPFANDTRLSKNVTNFYIDSKRRHWIVYWEVSPSQTAQYCVCFDEKKGRYTKDTTGIASNIKGYYELNHFTEFGDSIVMLYGYQLYADE